MTEAIEKKLGEMAEQLTAYQEKNDANQKKSDGVWKDELKTLETSISEIMEEKQKHDAEMKAEIEKLQLHASRLEGGEAEEKATDKKYGELLADYMKKGERGMDNEKFMEFKDLSAGSEPDGGFTLTAEKTDLIKTREFETSPMRQLSFVTNIGTDSLEVITDSDEAASGGWVGETATRGNTDTPEINKIIIPINEQFAQPLATQKILDDSDIDIESWLMQKVEDKLIRTENTAFVTGDGVMKPKGILSYTAGTDVTLGQIEQIDSGTSAQITADGLIDTQNGLKEIYQANATWIMKRTSFGEVMKLKDQDNNYLFNRDLDKNTGLPNGLLLGAPIMFADDMPVEAADSLSIAYGDFRSCYYIVDRLGIRVLRDPFTSKPFIKFYTTKRVGGGVVNFEAIKLNKLAA